MKERVIFILYLFLVVQRGRELSDEVEARFAAPQRRSAPDRCSLARVSAPRTRITVSASTSNNESNNAHHRVMFDIEVPQSGMTNKWLKEQGLMSVKEQWVKIHYPATAR
jgi:hypothetical protein